MAEHPRLTAGRIIRNRLLNQTGAADRIYMSYVPENKKRPYLLVMQMANVERQFSAHIQDPALVMLVKAVSTDEVEALGIAQAAAELLDYEGEQDGGSMVGGTDWHVLKVHVEERISLSYEQGTSRVFEESIKVRVILQEK